MAYGLGSHSSFDAVVNKLLADKIMILIMENTFIQL